MNDLPLPDNDQPATTPASPDAPPVAVLASSDLARYQDAFLLQLLAEAPGQRLTDAEANKKKPTVREKTLQMSSAQANTRRAELETLGYLTRTKQGRTVTCQLTPAGQQHLATLEQHPDLRPKPGIQLDPAHPLYNYQRAYLLLSIFKHKDERVARGEANKFDGNAQRFLELNKDLASLHWQQLAQEGRIQIHKEKKTERYELTSEGLEYLTALKQYPAATFTIKIKGSVFNELIDAARESAVLQPRAETPTPTAEPLDLAAIALAEFEELLREKYSHTGLVPVHEIRERIGVKYGEQAARHDRLDEPIKELWRQNQVRLVAINDLRTVTPEQLNASIQGVNETLFYLEVAHEHAPA